MGLEMGFFQPSNIGCKDCLTTRFDRWILFAKYCAIWLPILTVTGFLYARVILTLRSGAQSNARKRSLTIAFFVLWLSWTVLTSPYAVFEFCLEFIPTFRHLRDTAKGMHDNVILYNSRNSDFCQS